VATVAPAIFLWNRLMQADEEEPSVPALAAAASA